MRAICSSMLSVMIVKIVVALRVQHKIWLLILIPTTIDDAVGKSISILLVLLLFMLLVLAVIVSSPWPSTYTQKAFPLRRFKTPTVASDSYFPNSFENLGWP